MTLLIFLGVFPNFPRLGNGKMVNGSDLSGRGTRGFIAHQRDDDKLTGHTGEWEKRTRGLESSLDWKRDPKWDYYHLNGKGKWIERCCRWWVKTGSEELMVDTRQAECSFSDLSPSFSHLRRE